MCHRRHPPARHTAAPLALAASPRCGAQGRQPTTAHGQHTPFDSRTATSTSGTTMQTTSTHVGRRASVRQAPGLHVRTHVARRPLACDRAILGSVVADVHNLRREESDPQAPGRLEYGRRVLGLLTDPRCRAVPSHGWMSTAHRPCQRVPHRTRHRRRRRLKRLDSCGQRSDAGRHPRLLVDGGEW